jgi:hypothetical protein
MLDMKKSREDSELNVNDSTAIRSSSSPTSVARYHARREIRTRTRTESDLAIEKFVDTPDDFVVSLPKRFEQIGFVRQVLFVVSCCSFLSMISQACILMDMDADHRVPALQPSTGLVIGLLLGLGIKDRRLIGAAALSCGVSSLFSVVFESNLEPLYLVALVLARTVDVLVSVGVSVWCKHRYTRNGYHNVHLLGSSGQGLLAYCAIVGLAGSGVSTTLFYLIADLIAGEKVLPAEVGGYE